MGFVVEEIPQAVLDKQLPYVNPKLSSRWVVDRDRDAFMVLTNKFGGAYEGTQETKYYTLSWKNQLVHLDADPLPKTFPAEGAVMHWRVHRLLVPPVLEARRDEILELLRDAFRAVGQSFDGDRFVDVELQFGLSGVERGLGK